MTRAIKIISSAFSLCPSPLLGQITPQKKKSVWPTRGGAEGFTLAEILILIVIIGLLTGVITVNVHRYRNIAKQRAARQDIVNIMQALDWFWAEHGRFPSTDEGLEVLAKTRQGGLGPLLDKNHQGVDPWGQLYRYSKPTASIAYTLNCLGADSLTGGDGADADISSKDFRR